MFTLGQVMNFLKLSIGVSPRAQRRKLAAAMAATAAALVWFRSDLRLADNTALREAINYVGPQGRIFGIVLLGAVLPREWGIAKRDYYIRTVRSLRANMAAKGLPLFIRYSTEKGATFQHIASDLASICDRHSIGTIFWNGEYDGPSRKRDRTIEEILNKTHGIAVHISMHDQCVVPPGKVLSLSGTPYKIFSQFKKTWITWLERHGINAHDEPSDIPAMNPIKDSDLGEINDLTTEEIGEVNLVAIRKAFPAGEAPALNRLTTFLQRDVKDYSEARNHYSAAGCSELSAPLAVGAISPRTVLHAAWQANGQKLSTGNSSIVAWMSEVCWRDFYRHIAVHFPHIATECGDGIPFRQEFADLPWRGWPPKYDEQADNDLQTWIQGRTGYPIVDAAMRQMAIEHWLPNRLRMVVAMFLTKDLRIHWARGELYFAGHLIDYDWCSNNGGWQWSASTGTDAQPYFRVFNPLLQSEKYDTEGLCIRKYVAELRAISGREIHDPSRSSREACGYPLPMVDHGKAKEEAVAMFVRVNEKCPAGTAKNDRPKKAQKRCDGDETRKRKVSKRS